MGRDNVNEYLTIAEAADMLRVSPRTLRNKMASGLFRLGEHYVRPRGLGPRFKRDALTAWLEGPNDQRGAEEPLRGVPMARATLTRREAEG